MLEEIVEPTKGELRALAGSASLRVAVGAVGRIDCEDCGVRGTY